MVVGAAAGLNDVAILARCMQWVGRLFLGDGWMVYAGAVGATTAHAHHAYQLIRCRSGALALRGAPDVEALACEVAVIGPDIVHETQGGAPDVELVYVDPDTSSGRRLRRGLTKSTRATEWQECGAPLRAPCFATAPATWADAQRVSEHFVARLVGPEARVLAMHPAVLRARAWLTSHLVDDDISLDRVARNAGLSGDRLSHLFNEQLGLGLRPFILWLRLQRAARELGGGESLASAAAAAGFADGAHMTRTFRRMFGIVPSGLAGHVQWVLSDGPG